MVELVKQGEPVLRYLLELVSLVVQLLCLGVEQMLVGEDFEDIPGEKVVGTGVEAVEWGGGVFKIKKLN